MSQTRTPAPIETLARRDDATRLCARLHEIVARLTDVMEQETALLAANRHRAIAGLQEDKQNLTRAFLKHFTILKANAAFVGAQSPSHIDRLRKSLHAFGRCIERNLNSIDAARAVSQGLIQAMFAMATRADAGPACYGRDAALGIPRPTRPTAIAVDRAL